MKAPLKGTEQKLERASIIAARESGVNNFARGYSRPNLSRKPCGTGPRRDG